MSAIIDGTASLTGGADDGDVPMVGLGFSNDALELAAADEELSQLEALAGSSNGDGPAGEVAVAGGLPDEADPATTAPGADDGDVGSEALGLGFTDDQLRLAEEDDELHAIEHAAAGDATPLPGEGEGEGGTAVGGLVTQSTLAPTRKVKAAGLGGVVGAIPLPILSLLDLLPVSDAVLGTITAALTLLGSVAAAYLTRDRAGDGAPATTV
jgi:hypothetical protein